MNRRIALGTLCTVVLILAGCGGYIKTESGKEVEVSGRVNGPDGKPLKDIAIWFQGTGGASQSVMFATKADGTFTGKMNAGKYTFYLGAPLQGDTKKAEIVLKGLPEVWKAGALERQIDVSGGTLEIKF